MLVNIKLWVLKNSEKLFSRTKRNSIQTVQMAFRRTGMQKIFPGENYSTRHCGGGSLMIWGRGFSSSGKINLKFISGRRKVADYGKMLNDLPFAQECEEKWIFQQDNAAIHNALITKKYLLEQKNKTSWSPSVLSKPQSNRKFVRIEFCKSLWRRSTVLSNFWTQKRNLRLMVKIISVQLQKLVDSMPCQIFVLIKANGGSLNIKLKICLYIL